MSQKINLLIGIAWIIPFALIAIAGAAGADGDVVGVRYTFDVPRAIEEDGLHRIEVEGLSSQGLAGRPALPFLTAVIAVPYGRQVAGVRVVPGPRRRLEGACRPDPVRAPVGLDGRAPGRPTRPDAGLDLTSHLFPEKPYREVSVQKCRGISIALVNLYPVAVVPRDGAVYYYIDMDVMIDLIHETGTGADPLYRGLARDVELIRREVGSPGALGGYPRPDRAPGPAAGSSARTEEYRYVIITSEALRDAPAPYTFHDLVAQKTAMGVSATIVTTEWIYANYDGTRPDGRTDEQTRIRNFIIDAYTSWGTDYVLLGGDGDGADVGGESGDDIVPARGLAAGSEADIAADLYYGCLDGTFDYDADGIYGEPTDGPGGGDVDLYAEVWVGRAAVDGPEEMSAFVAKTLAYQSDSGAHLQEAWLAGEYIGMGGIAEYGGNLLDEILFGSEAHGYATVGFAGEPFFNVHTLYDRDWPGRDWPASEILGVINANVHIVNHLGPGGVTQVLKLHNEDLSGLLNEKYFIGYSQAGYSGSFDNRDEWGGYGVEDCIAEHLTAGDRGAVAFIGNSRQGWGAFGSTDGPSQRLNREFWDAVIGERISRIGPALQDSKEEVAGLISDPLIRWCAYGLNLFGDPDLIIRTVSSTGRVVFDRDRYTVPAAAGITLYDQDLDLDHSEPDVAVVECSSDSEHSPETVTLVETGPTTQIFSGSIDLAPGPPAADGTLQAAHGDLVTVLYRDADSGAGGPAFATDTARIDTEPPLISDVAVALLLDNQAEILWSTDEESSSTVYFGESLPLGSSHEAPSLVTDHSVLLTGLEELTAYHFAVESVDAAGNAAVDDSAGEYYTFTTKGFVLTFTDDMEAGEGDWTHWGIHDEWRLNAPFYGEGPAGAHSGEKCWGTDPGGPYNNEAIAYLMSGIFPMGAATRLVFWHWYDIELISDVGILEISTDGGAHWIELGTYSGLSGGWVRETFDLHEHSGDVRLRFKLWADDSVERAGWYIDDVTFGRMVEEGVVYQGHVIGDDAPGGDGDGLVEPGEAVELYPMLMNATQDDVFTANVLLTSADSHVTIQDDAAFVNHLPSGGSVTPADSFAFTIDPACPEGHKVHFDLEIEAESGPWYDSFAVTAHYTGCWDSDEDGFEDVICGGIDCDDTQASVNPWAKEQLGNHIDDDCDGLVDEGSCNVLEADNAGPGSAAVLLACMLVLLVSGRINRGRLSRRSN